MINIILLGISFGLTIFLLCGVLILFFKVNNLENKIENLSSDLVSVYIELNNLTKYINDLRNQDDSYDEPRLYDYTNQNLGGGEYRY